MAVNNNKDTNVGLQQIVRYMAVGVLAAAAFFGAYRYAQASGSDAQSTAVNSAPLVSAPVANGVAAGAGTVATGGRAGNPAPSNAAAGGSAAGGSCCGGGSAAGGGSCCGSGGGGSNQQVSGKTTVSGNVQKVTIDLTGGSYSPNQISAKAGVPLVLDFKGPASGCNGTVVSQQLGFQEDVSNGGTIKVAALTPGTYTFTCSMGMYIARIVVQ